MALAESVLQSPAAIRPPGAPRYEVVVHVDAEALAGRTEKLAKLENGAGLPIETARRLSRDGPIIPIVTDSEGNPLDVGRRTRSIPTAIRRALQVRDGGCRFPGCTHTHFVDGHHVKHWAKGGETKLDNLVLLCRHHHRMVHEDGYRLEMQGKRLVFFDPRGRLIDNRPYVPTYLDPVGLDRYAGFLSWMESQVDAADFVVPEPHGCWPEDWDLGLCIDVLVQRYVGPPPRFDSDRPRRKANTEGAATEISHAA